MLSHHSTRFLEGLLVAVLVAASLSLAVVRADDRGASTGVAAGTMGALALADDVAAIRPAGSGPSFAIAAAPTPTPTPTPEPTSTPEPTPTPEPPAAALDEPVIAPEPVTPPVAETVAPPPPADTTPPPPPPAPEPSTTPCDYLCRGDRIVAGMALDVPDGWRVEVLPGRNGEQGRTFSSTRTIELYVRDSLSDSILAYALEHEAAHAWDFTTLTRPQREQWASARGYPEKVDQWYGGGGNVSDDRDLPAGDFAEAAAACVRGPAHHRSGLGGAPTPGQCQLVLSMVGLR